MLRATIYVTTKERGVATSRATSSRRRQRRAAEQRLALLSMGALYGFWLCYGTKISVSCGGSFSRRSMAPRIGDGRREDEHLAGAGGDPGGLTGAGKARTSRVAMLRSDYNVKDLTGSRVDGGIRVDSIHNW